MRLMMKTKIWLGLSAVLGTVALNSGAAIPSAEKLLPGDTLIMVTAPDYARLRALHTNSPESQLWRDPAMKPFRDKFMAKCDEELVRPLERDLGVRLDDYAGLLQGQVTVALTQNGWPEKPEPGPGLLLLVDARDKSSQLKTNLAALRRKWVDAGKPIKTEKILNFEFSVLPLSSNDLPKTLRAFLPQRSEVHELGVEEETGKPHPKPQLVLGQVDSMLVVGNSLKVVEPVVIRLTGGSGPTLGELAAYDANHQALFRGAPLYGWANMKTFIDSLSRRPARQESEAPNPFDMFKSEKIFTALGLGGLKTVAFSLQDSAEGSFFQLFVGVPEASRQGLFKILTPEAKESSPPPFVPADVVQFQRWRLDGQKAWAALEKTLSDISPQTLQGLNGLLDFATARAKEKDPGFDLKKSLIGNLGDDIISFERAPRGGTAGPMRSAPTLVLVGSPRPDLLAAALKSVLVSFSPTEEATEREFLGRKIFSVPAPAMPLPMPNAPRAVSRGTLSYAASGGYLALSADPATLEAYLRSSETEGKALRDKPGLAEALQKVSGPGTGLLGYDNDLEQEREQFEAQKKDPGAASSLMAFAALLKMLGLSMPEKNIWEWKDYSLLPPFDRIAKYYSFSVYGGSASVEGLTLKVYTPVPPGLKGGAPGR